MRVSNLEIIMPSIDDGSSIKACVEPLEKLINELKVNSKDMEK